MKQMLVPIMSAIVGVIAFFLTHLYIVKVNNEIDAERQRLAEEYQTVKVIVASRDLIAGEKLSQDKLGTKRILKSMQTGQHIPTSDFKDILQKKIRFNIKSKEPVEWDSLDLPYSRGSQLAGMVNNQLRAVSINVGGNNAVSSLIAPNDRVDVLGTFSFPSKTTPGEVEAITMTILQDVGVLATGQQLANDRRRVAQMNRSQGYSTVTLEVTPREAELLVFSENSQGRLTLTLRNPLDTGYLNESALDSVNFDHLKTKIPEYNDTRQKQVLKRNR